MNTADAEMAPAPRWQRARVVDGDCVVVGLPSGRNKRDCCIWVIIERPQKRREVDISTNRCRQPPDVYYESHLYAVHQGSRQAIGFRADTVELLPEFAAEVALEPYEAWYAGVSDACNG